MRQVGPAIPRPHSLRSFVVARKFDLDGVINSPELVDGLDMFRIENSWEMRTEFFICHLFGGRRYKKNGTIVLKKAIHSVKIIYIGRKTVPEEVNGNRPRTIDLSHTIRKNGRQVKSTQRAWYPASRELRRRRSVLVITLSASQ